MMGTSKEVKITDIKFAAASSKDVEGGLLGWASCSLNGALRLDGLAVRRTADGHLALSFPARKDSVGRQHPIVRPLDDHARREIEHAVFCALGLREELTR